MRYRTIGTDPKTRREVSALSLGAMLFGTATDEPTSFAILDRYVEAGGTFIDTADNYAYWFNNHSGRRERGTAGPLAAQPRHRRRGPHRHQGWGTTNRSRHQLCRRREGGHGGGALGRCDPGGGRTER